MTTTEAVLEIGLLAKSKGLFLFAFQIFVMAHPMDKTTKVLAIIGTASLVVIAGFCLFIVLMMYACSAGVKEAEIEARRDAEEMKQQMQKNTETMERKLKEFHPFKELSPPPQPQSKGPAF